MIVLGIETATDFCGIAVADDQGCRCEYRVRTHFAHTEHLLGLVDRALTDLEMTIDDLDGASLSIGPGLFTGLRIGVATVKGLLTDSSKRVVPVSTLEALAWNVPQAPFPICPMLDAKKQEVYAGLFEYGDSGELKRLMNDHVVSPEGLLSNLSGPVLFLGAGALRYKDLILRQYGSSSRFALPWQHDPTPTVIAQLGHRGLSRGEGIEAHALVPTYLRRLDAEVNLENKRKGLGGKA